MGTNKAWSNIVYTSAAPVIRDSFNSSSVADTQGGEVQLLYQTTWLMMLMFV